MTDMVRVTRGVWRAPEQIADLVGRAAALLQACPTDAVLAGATAARLHGLWLPPHLCSDALPVEVIVHRAQPIQSARPASRRSELRARRQRLGPGDVTSVVGLPVTSEAKTWIDLAARLSAPDLVALGDSALRGDTSEDSLAEMIERSRHCRGVVRARSILGLLDADSRSRPESHLRYALVSRGLPKPNVNKHIYSETGEWLAEPDLSYDAERLALEYNGADHEQARRMRRDITRENDVDVRGGWLALTFGPAEVFGRPDSCWLRTRRHLLARSHLPRRDPWSM